MPLDGISDDETISDNEKLWRRIFPNQRYEDRANSGGFIDTRGPLSLDISSLTTISSILSRFPDMFLAEVTVKTVRDAGCKIQKNPQPDNPAHAQIFGNQKNGGPSESQARKIALKSKIISSPIDS